MFSTEISIRAQLTKQVMNNDGKEENLHWENIKKLEGEQISAHVVASFWFHKKHIWGVPGNT